MPCPYLDHKGNLTRADGLMYHSISHDSRRSCPLISLWDQAHPLRLRKVAATKEVFYNRTTLVRRPRCGEVQYEKAVGRWNFSVSELAGRGIHARVLRRRELLCFGRRQPHALPLCSATEITTVPTSPPITKKCSSSRRPRLAVGRASRPFPE